ncbi:hypothetical protein OAK19_02900 [Aureispira]|nr:hypothetical protein [Aureispira sp.]
MRLLCFLSITIFYLSCGSNTETRPASADKQAVIKEIDEELMLNREEFYLRIKDKKSIELRINANEHSKKSHGKELLVKLNLNNLVLERTSWGKSVSEPTRFTLELSDIILERVYNTIERMGLNRSITKEYSDSGNVKYSVTLNIDKKEVINLTGGRDLMNNKVGSNLMLLANYLGKLANGGENEFMQWSEKFIDNVNME